MTSAIFSDFLTPSLPSESLVTVKNQRILFLLSPFGGPPSPTSYMEAPFTNLSCQRLYEPRASSSSYHLCVIYQDVRYVRCLGRVLRVYSVGILDGRDYRPDHECEATVIIKCIQSENCRTTWPLLNYLILGVSPSCTASAKFPSAHTELGRL